MAFRVGQEVMCINAKPFFGGNADMDGLREGTVYTIRALVPFINPSDYYGHPSVLLEEIVRKPCEISGVMDLGFFVERFRPITKKSTDVGMAILLEILDRETIKERDPHFRDILSDIDC